MSIENFAAPETVEQTISRLAKLSHIELDRIKKDEAKKLECTITALTKDVAVARKETDGQDNDLVESLEPYHEPVNGSDLLNEIEGLLQKHVVLPKGTSVAISLWIVGTYVFNDFRIFPKLLITSPEKRCGKTTLLELMEGLCYRSMATSNITPSAIFRMIELVQPILLIDKADTFLKDSEELRGIINSGHTRKGAHIIRASKVGESFVPERFSTWAPMVIAMIGKPADTILDRSIQIGLRRKLPNERVDKLPLEFFDERIEIRHRLKRWSDDTSLKNKSPELPSSGNDRLLDNWTPLLAIADEIGWRNKAIDAFSLLVDGAEDESIKIMLLSDIQEVFHAHGCNKVFSMTLVDALNDMEGRPWCEWKHGRPMTQNGFYPFKMGLFWAVGLMNKGFVRKYFFQFVAMQKFKNT